MQCNITKSCSTAPYTLKDYTRIQTHKALWAYFQGSILKIHHNETQINKSQYFGQIRACWKSCMALIRCLDVINSVQIVEGNVTSTEACQASTFEQDYLGPRYIMWTIKSDWDAGPIMARCVFCNLQYVCSKYIQIRFQLPFVFWVLYEASQKKISMDKKYFSWFTRKN